MKEIYINADDYNSDSIRTIQGNNNAEEYKIYLQYDNEKIDLTGKTVNLGFLRVGSTEGDIIENLNVTNPKEGEITLKITNKISKRNGTYSCQLAILGEGDFLEHTATFTLTVENNIFSDITKAIADSKDFTYLENILALSSKLSEKLKENTSSATNANNNLESNITEANNINSKLLENTSTATSLNKNLESNIDLAKEVKETIKDLDTKNTEATSNIGQLTGLNAKATELSNNIQQGLPLNSELIKNTESAKTANNELIATNNDAKVKKTDLDNSLEEAKKYISGLDGSQNIPKLRLDVTELQNGLKSNQALAYTGSSISANNTLEGRTEGMKIVGRTLVNLLKDKIDFISSSNSPHTGQKKLVFATSPNKPFTFIADIKYTGSLPTQLFVRGNKTDSTFVEFGSIEITSNLNGKIVCVCKQSIDKGCSSVLIGFRSNSDNSTIKNAMILEGDWTNKEIPSFFEGLKSFGEAEKVEDKYKISILSGYNLIDTKKAQTGAYLYNNGKYVDNVLYKYVAIEAKTEGILKAAGISSGVDIHITYWQNENFLSGVILNSGNNIKINPPSNCNLIKISFNVKITEIIFVKYNKKDILIKEPLKEREYIYEDNGQVKVYRPTKQYTFTGNETSIIKWATVKDENFIGFYITNDDIPNLTSKRSLVVCNNFPSVDGVITKRNMYIAANSVNICIEKSALTTPDIEGFRAWLKANPTTIVYQLAEPVVEIVENCVDIDLDTFGEKTYFNIENSIKGSLDFKVPSNIASIVQSTAREVNNIWDVINNLLVPGILDVNKKVALATIKNNLK
ncbi:BppU family phage baseplate upper protein [Clostridium perfringens]|uniref:BppU family phage baseplate upper protein n=1 Tax=Clostridium perfringens TaxID=1502 RepID=UPI003F42B435